MFERIAGVIALQWGWRRYGLAFAAGVIAAFAEPPYHIFPVLWIALPVLVWLLDGVVDGGARNRMGGLMPAFRVGWVFGFGFFLNGLWWVGEAFLVDAKTYAWVMPFAVVLLPGYLAIYTGLATAAARFVWSRGPSRVCTLAIALTVAEYARGHLFTGFPWNDFGYALAANTVLMQAASVVGLTGLTLPAILIFAAPASLDGGRGGRTFVLSCLALLAGIAVFGLARLGMATDATVSDVRLRLIQPDIMEWSKWRPEAQAEVLAGYIDLSATGPNGLRSGLTGISVLIWPESPFSFLLAREPWALSAIAEFLKTGPTTLITGAIRAEPPQGNDKRPHFYNSIDVIGSDGEIKAAYDKAHLVPFGEYLPFEPLFDVIGLTQLTQIKSAFTPGPGPVTLPIPGAPPAGMSICYEAVFPGTVIDANHRPHWIVNVTNDSWFGLSPGPYQHLYQARTRAVEEGLPLIRDANSGISAVIDSYGRLKSSLPLGKVGTLDSDLPVAIDPPLYATIRDIGVLLELMVMSLFTLWANLGRKPFHG